MSDTATEQSNRREGETATKLYISASAFGNGGVEGEGGGGFWNLAEDNRNIL